jgi:hypothetical protein
MTPETQRPNGSLSHHAKAIRKLLPETRIGEFVRAAWQEVLVPICGAHGDPDREGFTQAHLDTAYPCTEWRFQGNLGFGGKFRLRSDLSCAVDCYPEDETPARRETIQKANSALKELGARFGVQPTH